MNRWTRPLRARLVEDHRRARFAPPTVCGPQCPGDGTLADHVLTSHSAISNRHPGDLADRIAECAGCATRFGRLLALHRAAQVAEPQSEVDQHGELVPFPGIAVPALAMEARPAQPSTTSRALETSPRNRPTQRHPRGWRRLGIASVAAAALVVVLGGSLWDRGMEVGASPEVLRSGATTAVEPASGVTLDSAPLAFRWDPQPGATGYRLRLHAADGTKRHQGPWERAEAPTHRLPSGVADVLEPGSYYWVVEVDGDVMRRRLGPYVFHLGSEPPSGSASPPLRPVAALTGSGVPVTTVASESPAHRAGVRPGDRLLGWRRATSSDPRYETLDNPFAVLRLLREEALRGPVVLAVARPEDEDAPLEIEVGAGRWRLEVGAVGKGIETLDDPWRSLAEARSLRRQRRFEAAIERLESTLAARPSLPSEVAYPLAAEVGEVLYAAERFDAARTAYQRAAQLGGLLNARGGRPRLTLARHHTDLGVVAQAMGDLDLAESEHQLALDLRRRLAPGSVEVAVSLNNLGTVAHYRGDSRRSEAYWLEAAEVFAANPDHALASARLLVNLGGAAFSRGELDLAEERWTRAHRVRQRLRPDSLDVAATHNNLGLLAAERGQLERAEGHHRESLALRRRLAPDSLAVARSLHNLSALALQRGDLWQANDLETESAALRRRLAPDHLETAQSLLTLGRVALARNRLDEAHPPIRQALSILSRAQPDGGLDTALGLHVRGRLEALEGNPPGARRDFETALAQLRRHAPGSLFEATVLRDRIRLDLDSGNPKAVDSARLVSLDTKLRRAESIARRLAPDSSDLADTLGLRAAWARRSDDPAQARRVGLEALAVLDRQETLWGGSEIDRLRFDGLFADLYLAVARDLSEDDPEAVFDLVERYRARRVRALLETPSSARRRGESAERQTLAWRYQATRRRLATLEQGDDREAIRRLRSRLRDLGAQREALAREYGVGPGTTVRASELVERLEAGTLWVSFLVGESSTLVVALEARSEGTPATPGIHWLTVGREALEGAVAAFREQVESPALGAAGLDGVDRWGRELYDLVLEPLGPQVTRARRLVLVPDGPLDALPWAALPVGRGSHRYLVEERAISVALSGSVERALARRTRKGTGWTVVADTTTSVPRLAASREEAEAIAHRVPGAQIHLGAAGTEVAVRAAQDAAVLHLAVHGVLDARQPLDSHLVLAPGGMSPVGAEGPGASGRLHAWEVMEELDLAADLVTLSSCEGRGRSGDGSGPLGLVTAFHLAGARSVVASHWRVADRSTARLMTHFVDALVSGQPKDQALGHAQRSLLADPETRHPFHWAAFQLSGDGASPLDVRPLLLDSEVER